MSVNGLYCAGCQQPMGLWRIYPLPPALRRHPLGYPGAWHTVCWYTWRVRHMQETPHA